MDTPIEIGVAVHSELLKGDDYAELAGKHFSAISSIEGCKTSRVAQERNYFDMSYCDSTLLFAKQHMQMARGHYLLSGSAKETVPWFLEGETDAETLGTFMDNYITTMMTHTKANVYSWDVFDEVLADDSVWHAVPDYLCRAFKTARAVDPDVKLFYSDFGFATVEDAEHSYEVL